MEREGTTAEIKQQSEEWEEAGEGKGRRGPPKGHGGEPRFSMKVTEDSREWKRWPDFRDPVSGREV